MEVKEQYTYELFVHNIEILEQLKGTLTIT